MRLDIRQVHILHIFVSIKLQYYDRNVNTCSKNDLVSLDKGHLYSKRFEMPRFQENTFAFTTTNKHKLLIWPWLLRQWISLRRLSLYYCGKTFINKILLNQLLSTCMPLNFLHVLTRIGVFILLSLIKIMTECRDFVTQSSYVYVWVITPPLSCNFLSFEFCCIMTYMQGAETP